MYGELTEVVVTPKPERSPIISGELVPPGQPPVPPEPVPDCSKWRFFVEAWKLVNMESKTKSIPILTGYETITQNVGGVILTFQIPKFVNVAVVTLTCHYEWTAYEYNGCGRLVGEHPSGITTKSSAAFTNEKITNALVAADADRTRLRQWQDQLFSSTLETNRTVMANSVATDNTYAGAFTSVSAGVEATQQRIAAEMRDFAERMDVYNIELQQYELSAEQYAAQLEAEQQYQDQMEVVSNFIREDKVGTDFTVKGAGNKTISLTVGQEVTGAQLISSGIQASGSGHSLDPNATYIVADVVLTHTAPRVNVPGLWGTSFPGKVVITK